MDRWWRDQGPEPHPASRRGHRARSRLRFLTWDRFHLPSGPPASRLARVGGRAVEATADGGLGCYLDDCIVALRYLARVILARVLKRRRINPFEVPSAVDARRLGVCGRIPMLADHREFGHLQAEKRQLLCFGCADSVCDTALWRVFDGFYGRRPRGQRLLSQAARAGDLTTFPSMVIAGQGRGRAIPSSELGWAVQHTPSKLRARSYVPQDAP